MTDLRTAAQALVDRWDTPNWKDAPHTGKYIDALRAALSAPAGWQPIETAPKDGSMFLCWVSAVRCGETDEGQPYQQDVSQVDFCEWRTQPDIFDCGWFEPYCGQIADQQNVTHWMPLPAPPAAPSPQEQT